MGDESNPKLIFISDSLSPEEKEDLVALVREYIDVFAWNYEDMPSLDPQIMEAIEKIEVKKFIESGFIREEQHPNYVANIVPVLKKNGKIQVCIDFRDLNSAYPKDDFPLLITNVIIDNTCGFERMFFMDGFSGYNQIKMHHDGEEHTSFRTPSWIYYYTVRLQSMRQVPTILKTHEEMGKPFLIYIRVTEHALVGLLAQDDDNDHEQAIYYLSRNLSGAEPCYPPIKKECLALVFTVQKMQHYLYDIHFKPQNAVKCQAICDLIANHPLNGKVKLYQDIPDETYEANIVSKEQLCSNNIAEYNTLLINLDIAKQLGVKHLEVYGDSQLIVNRVKGEYELSNEDLILYHTVAIALANSFESFYIDYIPRLKNTYADALASLAATLALPERAT
uniref:RNase H type-1 domain-containing protein n=1 Tax=Asparagus officinalis TaxID=4686 RepID=Q2AAB2_ASPOF|nr:hypothetical protein 17.t00008 [Asparagus officinalis]